MGRLDPFSSTSDQKMLSLRLILLAERGQPGQKWLLTLLSKTSFTILMILRTYLEVKELFNCRAGPSMPDYGRGVRCRVLRIAVYCAVMVCIWGLIAQADTAWNWFYLFPVLCVGLLLTYFIDIWEQRATPQ